MSNLSFLSKVVERVAAARLSVYIESQQLLPCRQSAYRAHHSTETATISVHGEIVRTIDAGDVCAVVLLDLSAAFDTVDHSTLLSVLRSCEYGSRLVLVVPQQSNADAPRKTYQSDRCTTDRPRPSVPQGSVLGVGTLVVCQLH